MAAWGLLSHRRALVNEGSLSAAAVGPRALRRTDGPSCLPVTSARGGGPDTVHGSKESWPFLLARSLGSLFSLLAATGEVVEIRPLGLGMGREEPGDKLGKGIHFLLVVSTVVGINFLMQGRLFV